MRTRYWRLVSLITTWHVAASVCYYAVFAGTTLLRDAFGLSPVSVGFVVTTLTLGYAAFLLPLGVATDRFGERRTLSVGLLGLAVGVALIAAAPTFELVLVAAFLLGSFYGVATPGTNKAIFDNVDPSRQHRAIGLKQVGPPLGSAISSVLVTGLVGVLFWQAGFLVAAAVGLAVASLFYVAYAGAGASEAAYPDFRGLLGNRSYLLLVAAGTCLGAVFYTTTGYTVLYVEESIGAAVAVGGLVLAVLQAFSSAGRVLAGWLGDVLPGEPRTRVGSVLSVQALGGGVLFLLVPAASTPLEAGVVFALLGLFALGSVGLYYSFISIVVSEDDIGSASAGGQFAATFGGLFGPPAFGYLTESIGYGAGWRFLGGLSVLAVGLVIVVLLGSR
ncbi:MFS transporter [Halobacteriales archaeon QS_5_70_15]|nr:MAG: MFS transporter [Halobacteriales archaeon QS_5_70_15]